MPIYMKFEGIVGSAKGRHAGWIEVESCLLGRSTANTIGGTGTGSGASKDVSISKQQDTVSPSLFRESANGKPRNVTIDFVNGDDVVYLTVELEGALISSLQQSGSGSSRPMEWLTLNSTRISIFQKPGAADLEP